MGIALVIVIGSTVVNFVLPHWLIILVVTADSVGLKSTNCTGKNAFNKVDDCQQTAVQNYKNIYHQILSPYINQPVFFLCSHLCLVNMDFLLLFID